jgi:3-hydroxyisobutyrate dehydrogenase-like beta-hydroxyacid dehydrogenase
MAERSMQRVGFIGVGAMGRPLAERLLSSGIAVHAFDRDPDVMAAAIAAGVTGANSAREVCDANEVVFACLPTAEICRAVALGPEGAAGSAKLKIYIDMSTFGGTTAVEMAQGLREHGIAFLSAPIVGGAVNLRAGTVGVLVSGDRNAFDQTRVAFEAFGGRLFYLGEDPATSQAAKVMNNAAAYAAFLGTCEAVSLGMKAGLDMETAVAIINSGSGKSFWSELVFPGFMLRGRYDGTGAMEIGVKDVVLFLKEAERLRVETPMANATSDLQHTVLDAGKPGRDTLETFHYFSDLAGLPRQG